MPPKRKTKMEKTLDKIGDMSVEFIAMIRFAEDKEVGSKTALVHAQSLVSQIDSLCVDLPISDAIHMESKLRKYTRWIANGPVAQA